MSGVPLLVTRTGRRLDVSNIGPDDIDLEDIIWSTSMTCRYNGYVREFYSVAEHMVLCSKLVAVDYPESGRHVRAALLHDAVEAYVSDLPNPVKAHVAQYKELEQKVERVIWAKFGLPDDHAFWQEIKWYDLLALQVESATLRFTQAERDEAQARIPGRFRDLHATGLAPKWAAYRYRMTLRKHGYEV